MRFTNRSVVRALSLSTVLGVGVMLWPVLGPAVSIEPVAHADVGGGGSGCPEGYFCAKLLGIDGACKPRPCCQTGQTQCGHTDSAGASWPGLKTDKIGYCWKTEPEFQKVWCNRQDCGDDTCIQGCDPQGDIELIHKNYPQRGGLCGAPAN